MKITADRAPESATMKILFLHGWTSVPGGKKPSFLVSHGHTVLNPALPDDDFPAAVEIAQVEYDDCRPHVVVGSSRGGAVAMNIECHDTPLVLLCPAWKKWGSANTINSNTTILHSKTDDIVPYQDSVELVSNSRLPESTLLHVGSDHRLADPQPLQKMLEACQKFEDRVELVDVTVYYLEMLACSDRSVPAPESGLTITHSHEPSVRFYRFLYNAVGKDYHWLNRRKLSDQQLAATIHDPRNELMVLKVDDASAGFAELDRRQADEVELVQFGLLPEFIGRGLGKWFLQAIIDRVWSYRPNRFWLHTCSLDHAAALPTYKTAGFVQFKQERIRREL
jgi:GNAT superfamily N-acetyltransferase